MSGGRAVSASTIRATLASLASVSMLACAHVTPPPPLPPATEGTGPTPPEVVAAWESAADVFARNDAAGGWDGEACRETLAAFERVSEARNLALVGRGADASRVQDPRAVYMSGLVAERCGNADGARQLFSRALELEPSLCEARVAIGLADLDAGHPGQAREAFEQAIAGDPRCAPAYVNLAVLETGTDRDEALANLRRALSVRADYLPALNQMALVYLDAADEEPRLLDLAEVVCRQAQLIDPSWAPLYNTWALIDVAQGDITGAAAKLERAMQLDPRHFEAHMNFGQITLSQRAYADAARAFERAREIRPGSYDAALGLGVALRGLSRPDEAEAMYRAALTIDERRPEAYFDLAILYQEHRDGTLQQLAQAETFLHEFVERARGEARFAAVMQDVLRWCGDAPPSRRARATCSRGRVQSIHDALDILGTASPRPDWTR